MDAPTYQWLRSNILPMDAKGVDVLEVGSGDVNGSIRGHVMRMKPASYTGVDIAPGKGVDEVVSAYGLVERFGEASFGLVISTEMLEHVEDWQTALLQMKRVLKPGGVLVLTTRRPGFPRHCHPHDHWRFTVSNLRRAFHDFTGPPMASYGGREPYGQALHGPVVQAVVGFGVVSKSWKPRNWRLVDNRRPVLRAAPAPTKDLKGWQWRIWVKMAYRLRNPSALTQ